MTDGTGPAGPREVRIERTVAAPVERVFRAWTTADLLARWYCPNPDLALAVHLDPDPALAGGAYRVDMGDGRYVAEGRYTDVVEPRLVAFTWRWLSDPDAWSHVRVELAPTGAGTRVLLVHSGLADADGAAGHAEGWALSLDRLADLAASAVS